MGLEVVGGDIAHELVSVAPLDQRGSLRRQGFKFDRANFRPVLFALRAFLGLLIVVQVAVDAGRCAMKQVGHGPEQVFEIRFETRVFQRGGERVEDVGYRTLEGVGFGQGSRVGFVGERPIAIKLQFFEYGRGCGAGHWFGGLGGHGIVSCSA